jgi:hypothetical protein
MRGFSPPLYPKQKRKAQTANAYGSTASADPGSQKASASLFFRRLGGTSASPKSGTSRLKSKFIKG